jgi:hypothetical protein
MKKIFLATTFLLITTLSLPVFSQVIRIPDSPEGKTPSPVKNDSSSRIMVPSDPEGVIQTSVNHFPSHTEKSEQNVIIRIPSNGDGQTKNEPGVLVVDEEDKTVKIKIPSKSNLACECQFVSNSEIECPDGRSFVLNVGTNQSLKDIIREGQRVKPTNKHSSPSKATKQ